MPKLEPASFPKLSESVTATWAPIFLSPIVGSPERLVIGVVAANTSAFHVERANALHRLECLYGPAAETAIFASEIALRELQNDCINRGIEALTSPNPAFSGISLGNLSEGQANSVEEVAKTWLATLSSLHEEDFPISLAPTEETYLVLSEPGEPPDRLPWLVLNYVQEHRPGLDRFFSQDIREHRQRRRRSTVHDVLIDFSGSKLVANFGTFKATARASSVDAIKRRMWDLTVNRDAEPLPLVARTHEMIVQHPSADDPQISKSQYERLQEAVIALSEQAKSEELVFSSMTNVKQIGKHIVHAEAA